MEDSRRYKRGKYEWTPKGRGGKEGRNQEAIEVPTHVCKPYEHGKKSTDHLVTSQIETPGRAAFPSLSEKDRYQNLSLSRNNPPLPFKFCRNVPHINPVGANRGRKLKNEGQEGKTSILSVIATDQG